MLTPNLEKLILDGKAKFRTFVCGQSGSNLLPISEGTWIIITGFTYCNFSDPDLPFSVVPFNAYVDRSVHQIRFRSSKSNNHYIVKDDIRREVGAPGSDINLIVNGDFESGSNNWGLGAGWTVAVGAAQHDGAGGVGNLTYAAYTTIPGRRYRLSYKVTIIVGGGTVQPVLAGTNGILRSTVGLFAEEITAGSTNTQLVFVGNTGAGRTVTIDDIELILLPGEDIAIISGHYKFDCYLPHKNEVTVELVSFPSSIVTVITSAAAPPSYRLAVPPAGYGNAGFGGIAQVSQFRYDVGVGDEVNLPLTREHTDPDPPLIGGDIVQNGMEMPVTELTAINVPSVIRDFPIVNVEYVEIEGTMPANIQASN